eukprot:8346239-Pyramimonas_sp.AAC.1
MASAWLRMARPPYGVGFPAALAASASSQRCMSCSTSASVKSQYLSPMPGAYLPSPPVAPDRSWQRNPNRARTKRNRRNQFATVGR